MKFCPKCGTTKPTDQFNRMRRSRDGRQGYCRACMKAYNASYKPKYYAENREEIRRSQAEYRRRNLDEMRARDAAYYASNRDRVAEYRERNRAHISAAMSAYRSKNPHVGWVNNYRRMAQVHGFEPFVEEFVKGDVVVKYGSLCFYCEDGDFEHLDHYTPVSKGGAHTLENVRPSCAACNLAKSSKPGDEWEKLRDRAAEVRGW